MAIQLTPEQERRIQSVIDRGAYRTVEEALEAALAALEDRAVSDFEGTDQELEALIAEGLASNEMSEADFWTSLKRQTSEMLKEYKRTGRS